MLFKRREEKNECLKKIMDIKNIDDTVQKRKSEFNQSISLIDDILADGGISDTHLRMLINQIVIDETVNGLNISIDIKGKFAAHFDTYDKKGRPKEKNFEMVIGGLHTEKELMEMLGFVPAM